VDIDPVQAMLLIIATIFLVGIFGELVFRKTGVPDVVWLIAVGIVLGPVSGLLKPSQLLEVAPYFGAITLVVVLFDGGRSLRLSDLGRAAPKATILAVLGFSFATSAVAACSMAAVSAGLLPAGWTWLHAVLLGVILGGSSSAVVMPSLAKAPIDPEVKNLVNIESAFTDILCVVVAGALIAILKHGGADVSAAAANLAKAFGIGLGVGAAVGMLSLFVLRLLSQSAFAYPLTLAALMILYVAVDKMGGSAALAILTAAVLVGNAPALTQTIGMARPAWLGAGITGVHEQVTFIVKSFFFTLIGALIGPPWPLVGLGIVLGVALLVARWPAVRLTLLGSGRSPAERGLVWVSLPQGMAAGVLSTMPMQAGIAETEHLPPIVFAAATTTILLFAVGVPISIRRLRAESPPGAASGDAPAVAPTTTASPVD
jgi:cell volume regulation protein A